MKTAKTKNEIFTLTRKDLHSFGRQVYKKALNEGRNIMAANGLVAKVFLDHKDECDKMATDTTTSFDAFKQYILDLIEKEAIDMPSKHRISMNISQTRNKADLLSYLYNMLLAAQGLKTYGSRRMYEDDDDMLNEEGEEGEEKKEEGDEEKEEDKEEKKDDDKKDDKEEKDDKDEKKDDEDIDVKSLVGFYAAGFYKSNKLKKSTTSYFKNNKFENTIQKDLPEITKVFKKDIKEALNKLIQIRIFTTDKKHATRNLYFNTEKKCWQSDDSFDKPDDKVAIYKKILQSKYWKEKIIPNLVIKLDQTKKVMEDHLAKYVETGKMIDINDENFTKLLDTLKDAGVISAIKSDTFFDDTGM